MLKKFSGFIVILILGFFVMPLQAQPADYPLTIEAQNHKMQAEIMRKQP